MPDPAPHTVDPADEHLHRAEDDPLWNESYYFDAVDDDGTLGVYARIGRYPNLGVTWWTAMVVGPGRPVTASVAYDLPVAPGQGPSPGSILAVAPAPDGTEGAAGRFGVECTSDAPLETMAVHATAPAHRLSSPVEVYQGVPGEPTTLSMEACWTTAGVPYHYGVTTRYEIPCQVTGELSVGEERFSLAGAGQRDHSWGVRDWWTFGWCWAAFALDDGTRLHFADIRIPGHPLAFGYVQSPGRTLLAVEQLTVAETYDADGLVTTAHALVRPGALEVSIEPLAFGPMLLTAPDGRVSRFPRAMARCTTGDGRQGLGWIEWNQPQPVPSRGGTRR
jgi:hypothetical protein